MLMTLNNFTLVSKAIAVDDWDYLSLATVASLFDRSLEGIVLVLDDGTNIPLI